MMKFTKIEETQGDLLLVYFTDPDGRIQGELSCYDTQGRFPSSENLLYTKQYKDGVMLSQHWVKQPDLINFDND